MDRVVNLNNIFETPAQSPILSDIEYESATASSEEEPEMAPPPKVAPFDATKLGKFMGYQSESIQNHLAIFNEWIPAGLSDLQKAMQLKLTLGTKVLSCLRTRALTGYEDIAKFLTGHYKTLQRPTTLYQRFIRLDKGDLTIAQFQGRIEEFCAELFDEGHTLPQDEVKHAVFLNGIPDAWEEAIHNNDIQLYDDAVAMAKGLEAKHWDNQGIIDGHKRFGYVDGSSTAPPKMAANQHKPPKQVFAQTTAPSAPPAEDKPQSSKRRSKKKSNANALQTTSNSNKKNTSGNNKSKANPSVGPCTYCGKKGHMATNCFKRQRDIKLQGGGGNVSDGTSSAIPPQGHTQWPMGPGYYQPPPFPAPPYGYYPQHFYPPPPSGNNNNGSGN